MSKNILIIGYGYTAQHLKRTLLRDHYTISATSRHPENIEPSKKKDIKILQYNSNELDLKIKKSNYILVTAPPDINNPDSILKRFKIQLEEKKRQTRWLGYLSSTSIYGDHQGNWVNENSKPNNPSKRGLNRLKSEKGWLELFEESNIPIHIFRLAGIYGPGRNSLTKILNGKTHIPIKHNQIFSRIHIDDICRALMLSMINPTPGEIFNLADDTPCSSTLVDNYAAHLLQQPPLTEIPYNEADLSPAAMTFYKDSKKVSNEKIKKILNYKLLYPSYKEGLSALIKSP